MRGALVDDVDQPIKQADVWLTGYWMLGLTKHGFQVADVRSDTQGRFEIHGLWPGEYQLQFGAPGFERQRQPSLTLQAERRSIAEGQYPPTARKGRSRAR